MGMFGKIVLGGATVAAMSTGQVQAAENSTPMDNPNANPKEIVVNPQDNVTNSDNILDLSNEFMAKQFEIQAPGTIDDLKQTLSNPTTLTQEQIKDVVLWRNYIGANPKEPDSQEAFVLIRDATNDVTNRWIQLDQYYAPVKGDVDNMGTYDQLKYSKEALIKNMDAMLEKPHIRENIPEARVKNGPEEATDYATMRLYTQINVLNAIEKNPQIMREYIGYRDNGGKKGSEYAQLIAQNFYNTYGIDINKCQRAQDRDIVYSNVVRESKLLDPEFKEQAYMYCLHRFLDRSLTQNEGAVSEPNLVYVDNKPFYIPGDVSLAIEGYANLVAKNARGEKLTKQQESILYSPYSCPPDMRDARDAYFSRCTDQLTALMNRPRGEYVTFTNTNGINDATATKYVNLLRLGSDYTVTGKNQMTDNDRAEITRIEENRPDLKSARIYYESQIAKQKSQQQQQSATYITQNFGTHR